MALALLTQDQQVFLVMFYLINKTKLTVFVKEPAEITLSLVEDTMMEAKFTRRIGPLLCPGRQARLLLPQTEPRPSNFVNTINIVVKLLDQTMFPVQARYLNEMIRDLGQLNLFNQIIGRNRNIIIREFNGQELRFDPPSNVGDLVHKDICIL
ncbi:hypothetical protein RhiirA1_392860 [Rhizophagus irregularis]|uniref:Uncharacterized protein n=3 Tax=Rhizophagus irregularis TaxID=588596 RepID=A0A2N0RYY4_9GLOM|nr:hypothetical protein GLOIN_2v1469976 [Rhizophagus irregularis DAOM 181602=DAOM 197198]EXX53432.1 hypothetical protein RirG_243810 [Rhizophagus irregularis DAOM 197198w]PKC68509.1 hypothetical protein RhiirA1_392860 [Rhizophagus irregularis]PKK75097.1 hypothetical protein RhiirC2_708360 [Rhizophagus irregularis]POG82326.1 hypothetical protein GLOIN_2v1469976 [Rhizophagus irregularis DAOM 181602=DAOM 197198]|eukprot:XP_025189192.1 hypothetical protein GLOIN_2v1469976 [Rhizophagus irregularis DAOM 181602=DAOM 197198]